MPGESTSRAVESKDRLAKVMAGLAFFGGVIAAVLSAYANYYAFAGIVEDETISTLFGYGGIAASLISFSAFTVLWWNLNHNAPLSETWRAALVGLIAASTSVMGSWMFMQSEHDAQLAAATKVQTDRAILTKQVERYQKDLDALPASKGSASSIKRYLKEVEASGVQRDRYYRGRIEDLALEEKREELTSKRDAAEARLLLDESLNGDPPNRLINPWILAILWEIFASQATAMGTAVFLTMQEKRDSLAWLAQIEEDMGDT